MVSRPPPPWMLATIFGNQDTKEWSNEFWYVPSVSVAPSNFDPATLAADFFNAMHVVYVSYMHESASLKGAKATVDFTAGTFGGSYYSTEYGTLVNDALPEDVAVVVQKQTAHAGRSGTGRWRLTGMDDSCSTGSYLSPTGTGLIQAWVVQAMLPITSQTVTYTPAHYSKKLGSIITLQGADVEALLGTVRRRRPRF